MKLGMLCIGLLLNFLLLGQETSKTSDLIEGGKIVVDLFSVLKSGDKSSTKGLSGNCKRDKTADICFENKRPANIQIDIKRRSRTTFDYYFFYCHFEFHQGSQNGILKMSSKEPQSKT